MPTNLKRYHGDQHLHFVTFSCYRRRPFLSTARRRDMVLHALERTRISYGFCILGYVIMPEHVHVLLSEPERKDLSTAIKAWKQAVGRRALGSSRKKDDRQFALFAAGGPQRFWQTRFYDFNIFTDKKRVEKLKYMHRNPVVRRLVADPAQWRWSSYGFYALDEPGPVHLEPFPDPKPVDRLAARA